VADRDPKAHDVSKIAGRHRVLVRWELQDVIESLSAEGYEYFPRTLGAREFDLIHRVRCAHGGVDAVAVLFLGG